MAYIIIDGYNLIGINHGNLEKARTDIIEKLRSYAKIKDHEVTLVFDGWKSGQRDETQTKTRNLTVIYSKLGEKADQTIIKKLSSHSKPWIVVSSDREIADYAAQNDYAAVSSLDFDEKLYSTLRDKQPNNANCDQPFDEEFMKYYDDEFEDSPVRHKGNARKLSKKDKLRQQALKKL